MQSEDTANVQVPDEAVTVILATRGRSLARAHLVRDESQWWYGLDFNYSYGGFSFPVNYGPFETQLLAERAATEHMLKRFHTPSSGDPDSVKTELADLRRQVESRLRQPSLF